MPVWWPSSWIWDRVHCPCTPAWDAGFSPARQWLTVLTASYPASAGLWDFAMAHSARPHSAEESFSSREAQFCIQHIHSSVCNKHGLHHGVMLLSYLVHNSYLCLAISSSFARVNKSGLQWTVLYIQKAINLVQKAMNYVHNGAAQSIAEGLWSLRSWTQFLIRLEGQNAHAIVLKIFPSFVFFPVQW